MTDISINGRELSKFNPVATLDNEDVYSQKDLDEEREAVIDQVMEIIDKRIEWCREQYNRGEHIADVYALALVREDTLALKGGEHEDSN